MESLKRGLIIGFVGLVVLVIIVLGALSSFSLADRGVTGDVAFIESRGYICEDSDGGSDMLVKGTVTRTRVSDGWVRSSYEDYCLNRRRAVEYKCDENGYMKVDKLLCEGICVDGACAN
jgi:hypothetical protein